MKKICFYSSSQTNVGQSQWTRNGLQLLRFVPPFNILVIDHHNNYIQWYIYSLSLEIFVHRVYLTIMDINEAFARLQRASKNVEFVVINKDNFIIRSSNGDIAKRMNSLVQVVDQCRAAFKENEELTFLKIRTSNWEYLVVPDKEYMLVCILNSNFGELSV